MPATAAGRGMAGPWSRKNGIAVPDALARRGSGTHSLRTRPVEVALHTAPAVVVLGDPGSGKSTLLKVLPLALAAHQTARYPFCYRSMPMPVVSCSRVS